MQDFTRWDLKIAILKTGIPQNRIAKRLDKSPAWMSLIVNGLNDPSPRDRQAIAEILEKPEKELFPEFGEEVLA